MGDNTTSYIKREVAKRLDTRTKREKFESYKPLHKAIDKSDRARVVAALAAVGIGPATIASACRISLDALHRDYAEELKQGQQLTTSRVVTRLMDLIEDGHPGAIFFWLKCRNNWSEINRIEVSNPLASATTQELSDALAMVRERRRQAALPAAQIIDADPPPSLENVMPDHNM